MALTNRLEACMGEVRCYKYPLPEDGAYTRLTRHLLQGQHLINLMRPRVHLGGGSVG